MSKIVLILGSGPRVGEATSAHFAQAGYKVALVSRSIEAFASQDKIHIKADLSDPTAIGAVFQRVQEQWGAPSVVIYNRERGPTPFFISDY
jgi:NAD(P)-dependent dehydrogenase (short-subunit alcohol dehydrogenase family)